MIRSRRITAMYPKNAYQVECRLPETHENTPARSHSRCRWLRHQTRATAAITGACHPRTAHPIILLLTLLAQCLAGLEMRHVLARQRDGLAGLGVASHARRAIVQRETAESANLDTLAVAKDWLICSSTPLTANSTSLKARCVWRLAKCLDQLGFGHRIRPC